MALTIEVTGDHRRDLWRQAQAMWAMDNGRPLPAQNASWSQLGNYYEREYAATAPAHHKYLTEGYAATRGNVGPRGKTFMTPEQFSFYKRQDDLLLLKVATAPMVSATLGALAVASPVIGGGLSVYGMYSGANTLANADSAADYALGTIELVGSALGLSYATRQLSSARGAVEMAWMPLGTRGQTTALTSQTKGWQDFGVVPDYSKLKFYSTGPVANIPSDEIAAAGRTYSGGAYGRLSAQRGVIERHHAPADSVSPYTTYSGPAIQMDYADHFLTSSHGSQGLAGVMYRSEIKQLTDAGNMRGAMAMEIRDVRRVSVQSAGTTTKYNAAIREMLDYAYGKGYLKKGP